MAKKLTQTELLEAIKNSQGIISTVQQHLKVMRKENVSWHAVDDAIKRFPECQRAMQDEKEAMLDVSENIVFQEILKHDVQTAKWYLKMKGKDRGYEEVPTIKIDNDDPLNINFQNLDAATIAAQSNVELGGDDEEDAAE